MILEKELNKLADLYEKTNIPAARRAYDEIASLIIEDEPKEKRRGLYDLYDKLKDGN